MKRFVLVLSLLLASACYGQSSEPLLLRQPTVSQTQIALIYGGDLWIVSRNGGDATRLTAGLGTKSSPEFSPDGKTIAFTGEYSGNRNVYLIPSAGGTPRRLTFHSGPDEVVGWTPDGKKVLFSSPRQAYARGDSQLYTISAEGGFPTRIPLPMAFEGSYSADGSHLAYRPLPHPFGNWSHYRGGTAMPIWIANLADSTVEKIPRDDENDFNPMWIGNKIYFLSDRNGPFTLFVYDVNTKKVSEVIKNEGLPFKFASAGPGAIVYEQFGSIHLYDLKSERERAVDIRLTADLAEVRPHFENVAEHIENAVISPTGVRAAFEAHGEILTAPAEKGNIRNLTNSPSVEDRDPAWSPDGKWIAYFSDDSGEYALHLRDQSGMGEVKKISLGNPPSFFYSPQWSPDSKKIAYTDKRLNVWYIDLDKQTPVKLDTDYYENPQRNLNPSWSPDSEWITYTKMLENHLRAVFVYSLEYGKATQITDGMSDAEYAAFDKNGKYLYFTASTNIGPTTGWLDLSSFGHQVTRSVYVVVLRKDLPSPLAPESDEEKVNAPGEAAGEPAKKSEGAAGKEQPEKKKEEAVKVTIDFDGIGQRILALPIPPREYIGLAAGKTGEVFLLSTDAVRGDMPPGPPTATLYKFDLKKRKVDSLMGGLSTFDLSFDGEKFLYQQGKEWGIAGTEQPIKPGEGRLKLENMEVWVEPRAEWKQMFNEVWRIERDFLYDPHLHGVDIGAMKRRYEPFLARLGSRDDLNYLFEQMLGEINVGHMFVFGGNIPEVKPIRVGLLGADYSIENGRYRFAHVFNGENWNPQLRAPLTQPGVNVKEGEYLLAVNGLEVHGTENVYSFFQETAGKQIVLKVGPNPDGSGSREVTVVPVESEAALRNREWIEDNLRLVDKLSGGKIAYVYLPDTANGGYTNFNRYFFAQVGKPAAVIDERFNAGGAAADYVIEYLQRKTWNYWMTRQGADFTTPEGEIPGPKAMVTNEYAGSGGDALPWYFHHVGLGPLIGKRTWGGLVGIYDYPTLMDGGVVTAPRVAFFNTEGQWDVENHGVAPDIQVELDPHAWREGHDTQLEKAVDVVMKELGSNPPQTPKHPPFPDYSKYQ